MGRASDHKDEKFKIKPVTTETVSSQVARQLKKLLTSGEVSPGERIPSERELATRFGVGRPAVREALRELKAQGLLISGRGPRGTIVAAVPGGEVGATLRNLAGSGAERLVELMELRVAVEVQAAGLAARRATLDEIRRMARIQVDLRESDHAESDVAFHRLVAESAHNVLLKRLAMELVGLLHEHMPRILDVLYTQPGGAGAVQRQHDVVLEAIRRGDESSARRAMRQHLDYVTIGLAQLAGSIPPIRLVIADLDGTLLAGPRHLSRRTRNVVATVREAGAEVVLASARAPRLMRLYHEELQLSAPVIACNGALLWDMLANVPMSRIPLSPTLAREAVAVAREAGAIANVECDDEWFADRITEAVLHNIQQYGIAPPHQVGGVDDVLTGDRPIDKVFLDMRELPPATQETLRTALSRSLGAHVNLNESVRGMIDVTSLEASKAAMAQQLARMLGVPAEQVLAIGDGDNDVALLRWAGVGVAMGNASPAAKGAADAVTSSDLRDGAAEAMQRWVLERPANRLEQH
ncbi:MAG: Cof-type HAD-IIB family hydrolase [Actinobacteria bacterium]|nr:Cof-type HAD-IIB family hydrolase [Actinomycetota bacterium]